MSKFERIFEYYRAGLWSQERIKNAVARGYITKEEAKRILSLAKREDRT